MATESIPRDQSSVMSTRRSGPHTDNASVNYSYYLSFIVCGPHGVLGRS